MNQSAIAQHIEKQEIALDMAVETWNKFVVMQSKLHFSEDTYNEVRAKTSAHMAQLQMSINDHKKLLSKN